MKKYALKLVLSLVFSGILMSAKAQDDDSSRATFGVHTTTSLSYVGWRQNVNVELNLNGHRISAGPGLSLSDAYLPWESSYGFQFGYRYLFDIKKGFISSAGVSSQTLFGRQNRVNRRTITSELLLNYGFGYRRGNWYVLNTLGFGGYREHYYNHGFEEYQNDIGYNFQLTLTLGYDL